MECLARLLRSLQCELAIGLPVGLRHVREARAEAIIIRAGQRILSLQIDVVGEHDQCTLLVLPIDAAGCVGKNHGANVHAVKHPHGESDFPGGIAFVQVHASLHGGHRHAGGVSDHHLSGVTQGGRARKERNVGIGNARGVGKFVGETTQTGAQHQSYLRAQRRSVKAETLRRLRRW